MFGVATLDFRYDGSYSSKWIISVVVNAIGWYSSPYSGLLLKATSRKLVVGDATVQMQSV